MKTPSSWMRHGQLRLALLGSQLPRAGSADVRSSKKSLPTLHEAATTCNAPEVWLSPNFPRFASRDNGSSITASSGLPPRDLGSDRPPNDERKVKLGKTLQILQKRLPTLLQTPLPQDILSPNISLHLFPSTHPHLPVVSGRVAYKAALWTSPIAWNRLPVVGNVRLEILSERMVRTPYDDPLHESGPRIRAGAVGEQLIVRWRTLGKTKGWAQIFPFLGGFGRTRTRADREGDDARAPVGTAQGTEESSEEFTGIFIFDFDKDGKILIHTIEHAQEGGQWERGVGAKVVGLTDWLLGGIRRGGQDDPGQAFPAFWRDTGDR